VIEASLSTRVFIVLMGWLNIARWMVRGKRNKDIRAQSTSGKAQPVEEFRIQLVKRPQAVNHACVYISWANRRRVLESELVSSTEMIEQPDATDEPDGVLDAKEGRIHIGWSGYKIVGRVVVARRRHDDNARPAAMLRAREPVMRMSPARIVSSEGGGNAWRLP
jgi:hypothetical protein